MPEFLSPTFGRLEYEPSSIFVFPQGLPAFEEEHEFLLVQRGQWEPLVFLQSVRTPDLVFSCLPAQVVAPDFRAVVTAEDREMLALPPEEPPDGGPDLLCLVMLAFHAGRGTTANLLAPLVLSPRTGRGTQVIQLAGEYSHQHPVLAGEGSC